MVFFREREQQMETFLGLSKESITESVQGLSRLLASTYILSLQTQNAHWNLEGRHFYMYHKFFEEHYNALALAIDLVAERIRSLGHKVPATLSAFETLSEIKDEPLHGQDSHFVATLLKGHETIIDLIRHITKELKEGEDEGTLNLLADRVEMHEKMAWMLRSHLSSA